MYDDEKMERVPNPSAVAIANNVIKAGLVQFPESAYLHLVQAAFQTHLLAEPSVCALHHCGHAVHRCLCPSSS